MNWINIKNATILSIAKKSFAGYIISYCLRDSYKKLCQQYNIEYNFSDIPNHDAYIFIDNFNSKFVIESISPKAKMTPLDDYLELSSKGKAKISSFEFINITDEQRKNICEYWLRNINGRPYDYISIIKIGLKILWKDIKKTSNKMNIFKDNKENIVDMIEEHSFYCTEGVQEAAKSQGYDVWGIKYSTPCTTLQRKLEGKLI